MIETVETVSVGDVACDDHDRRIGTVGAIGRLRLGATDLEIDPGATAGPGAERDQVAEGLRADGLERRLGERQIGRMDEIEHRGADEVARIPVEYMPGHRIRVQEGAIARDREDRITEAIE